MKTKKMNRLFIFAALFFAFSLQAQDTTRVTLETILIRMDTSYPALLEYHQKLQAVQARTEGSRSWMPPTVSLGFDRWGYQPGMWTEDSPMNQAGIMFSVEQMFPNPKKLDARQNAIAAGASPLQYDSAWLKNNLRLKARLYYYQRLIAEHKLAVLQQSISTLDLLIATAETGFSTNQAELSSIFKAKARKAELQNMELMLQAQINESNIGLNTLMNRDVSTPFLIESGYSLQPLPDTINYDSLKLRSDILAMNAGIYAMRQQQNYMKSGLAPEFGVRVTHMQMLGMPNQFSVMGMMVIPLAPWSSGMYNSEVRAMDFEIREMELEREAMQLMAQQMAAERLSMLQLETQQWQNYDSLIIPSYENNYNAANIAWRNNSGSFFVLLDAWDMLLMKKMEAQDQLLRVLILQSQYQYELEN